jgi:hypothetical protein
MYAEVIYEPGSKSVMSYETEDELKAALLEHHNRAKNGDLGGPAGGPAERIHKVFTYDEHPADKSPKLDAEAIKTLIDGMADNNDTLDHNQLISAIRDEASPVYPLDQGRHHSMYKQDGNELALDFLDGDAA